jgi:hypothetical protein
VASMLDLSRNGAVGFIDWLGFIGHTFGVNLERS